MLRPDGVYRPFAPAAFYAIMEQNPQREGTRDMKKTWHTVFLILLICLDAALLLLPLLPGYRALFDIGPYPGRLPAFRFLKLAGYALFFP
ncbi:MAG: hypothetical protein ACLR1P_02045 [Oscillospiraceae bacterium]